MNDERAATGRSGGRWPVWRLALVLFPFVAAACAINLFLLGLMGQAIGLPALTPSASLIGGFVLGVPASLLAGKWVRSLMDEAE